jgi:transposase
MATGPHGNVEADRTSLLTCAVQKNKNERRRPVHQSCRVNPPKCMLGDKAYDSAELREELDEQGTKPVIPNRSNRKQPFRFSKRLYKLRWRIEAAFNRLKDFRRIATATTSWPATIFPLCVLQRPLYRGFN